MPIVKRLAGEELIVCMHASDVLVPILWTVIYGTLMISYACLGLKMLDVENPPHQLPTARSDDWIDYLRSD